MSDTVLDESVLAQLTDDLGGDVATVKELVHSFLDEAPQLLAEGRRAAQAADAGTCQRAYHTLKGNAATFGAVALRDAAKAIEQPAKMGTMPTPQQMDACDHLFAAARAALLQRYA